MLRLCAFYYFHAHISNSFKKHISGKMQGLLQAVRSRIPKQDYSARGSTLKKLIKKCSHQESIPTKHLDEAMSKKGLHDTTVAQVLTTKGEDKVGCWLWCRTDDTVYDAVKKMAENNIGSLVVLKPGQQQHIAGILTERDYLRKVVLQDRASKYTRVGEIMTDRDKLLTVTSDTNILHAMQLMTENHIRHAPVIDGKIVGMISMVDVVRTVLQQQNEEMKRLNEFIRGDYY